MPVEQGALTVAVRLDTALRVAFRVEFALRVVLRVDVAVSDRNMRSLLQQMPGSLHEGKVDGVLLDLGISSMQVRVSPLTAQHDVLA